MTLESFNTGGCVYPSPGYGQSSYRTQTNKKRTVTTVTEYDEAGRVVKVTTTEETVDTTPSWVYPTYTINDFTITSGSDTGSISAGKIDPTVVGYN